jgi:hypothetical protein
MDLVEAASELAEELEWVVELVEESEWVVEWEVAVGSVLDLLCRNTKEHLKDLDRLAPNNILCPHNLLGRRLRSHNHFAQKRPAHIHR